MHTTLYPSPDAFTTLASEWNPLLHQTVSDTPFLTLEYQRTWWQHFGGDNPLRIAALRDQGGVLRGLAPLFVGRSSGQRKLYLVGCAEMFRSPAGYTHLFQIVFSKGNVTRTSYPMSRAHLYHA